jgi:hypothetical protein
MKFEIKQVDEPEVSKNPKNDQNVSLDQVQEPKVSHGAETNEKSNTTDPLVEQNDVDEENSTVTKRPLADCSDESRPIEKKIKTVNLH